MIEKIKEKVSPRNEIKASAPDYPEEVINPEDIPF